MHACHQNTLLPKIIRQFEYQPMNKCIIDYHFIFQSMLHTRAYLKFNHKTVFNSELKYLMSGSLRFYIHFFCESGKINYVHSTL